MKLEKKKGIENDIEFFFLLSQKQVSQESLRDQIGFSLHDPQNDFERRIFFTKKKKKQKDIFQGKVRLKQNNSFFNMKRKI